MSNLFTHLQAEPETDDDAFTGMDELNLAEFPLAVLGERPEGVKALEFCDTVLDSGTGKTVTRKLTVTGSELHGLPSHLDDDVLVVMMYLTNQLKLQSRTVPFSRYRLIELLGWSHGGKSYERLEESLNRWLGVTLHYENAWRNKQTKAWVDRSFHLLSELNIHDRRGRSGQSELPLSSFTWNDVVFESFLARHTKSLDLNDYFSLKLAPAKRIYRFLDKRFGARRGNVWRFDLHEFACEHIGFSRGYDSAQLKRKMKPSLTELEQYGFLKPMAEDTRFPKGERRGQHYIVVEKATSAETEPASAGDEKPAFSLLETALIDHGVTASVAAELVAQFPPETIQAKLDVLAWLNESNDPRAGKSPAGYLVQSIRDDYTPPSGFIPKAAREKSLQEVADRRRQEQEAALAQRERDMAEASARLAERTHIERHLGALLVEERNALEERALAAATPEEREQAQSGAFADTLRRLLVDRQVLKECPLAEDRPIALKTHNIRSE